MNLTKLKFVIPSYKRSNIIKQHTLKLLEDFKIPKKQIYIFVVPDEYEDYKKELPEYKVIIGEFGLAKQRNFIHEYFKENDYLVCLDDDLYNFFILEDGNFSTITDDNIFKSFIYRAFNLCKEYNANLWGISQTKNPRYMRDSITFDFSFIAGHFWGCINQKNINLTLDIKEDYERTIKYWLRDKCIVKLNYISAHNKIYKIAGGCQASNPNRIEDSKNSSNFLIQQYPQYFKIRNTQLNSIKPSLHTELKLLKHVSDVKIVDILAPINPNCPIVINLLEKLNNVNLPMYYKRENSGPGITHCFGEYRIRKKIGLFPSVNNSKYPSLYEAINEFGNKYVKPHLAYTSIQVNKNYKSKPHIDKNNIGKSFIIGLGDYNDGELIINSYKYDIKYRPLLFNGAKWKHSTENFTNTRYSLIYFLQN